MSRQNLETTLSNLLSEPEARTVVCMVMDQDGNTGLHMKASIGEMLLTIHLLRNEIRKIEANA